MAVKLRKKPKKLTRKDLEILAVVLALVLLALMAVFLFRKTESPAEPTQTTQKVDSTRPDGLQKNPYGPYDFQYRGQYLALRSGESVLGIDVSSHQGAVDWQQVAQAGVEFVLLRVGYRGYGNGQLVADELAQKNYEGARAAGLKVGAYIFSQAVSVEEAREETEFFLEQTRGWQLDMPAVYDWEYISADARTANVDRRTLTDCALAFCRAMEAKGHTPMIYFNLDLAVNYLYLEELTDYHFWLALYSDRMTYPYRIDMWQYTHTGTVPGISGDVDINLYFP